MKLHQLRYLVEIVRHELNISKAAEVLCTSQSGISKQIKLLEDELKIIIFVRRGRNLVGLTQVGNKILNVAKQILNSSQEIRKIAEDYRGNQGSLVIATTHTQARYVLPYVVERFMRAYPNINLNLQQGTPDQIAKLVVDGDVDIAIATESLEESNDLITLPCYQWSRSIIVKQNHPLAQLTDLSLEDIAAYPIVTYTLGFTGRYMMDEAFAAQRLDPNIVLTAVDADVIKTYVRLGLGIGIIANMAFNPEMDNDLVALGAKQLFGVSRTHIAIKKDQYVRDNIFRFIEMFAPHLTKKIIKEALECVDWEKRRKLFTGINLPTY
jgi:LysR family transcriptional regulator, cys regulon transcriptional activator